jgi:hypothetical protein
MKKRRHPRDPNKINLFVNILSKKTSDMKKVYVCVYVCTLLLQCGNDGGMTKEKPNSLVVVERTDTFDGLRVNDCLTNLRDISLMIRLARVTPRLAVFNYSVIYMKAYRNRRWMKRRDEKSEKR